MSNKIAIKISVLANKRNAVESGAGNACIIVHVMCGQCVFVWMWLAKE